jgi:hypothetical protein
VNFTIPKKKIIFPLENLSSVFLFLFGGWVVTFLIAIVDNKSDEEWLDYLISDEIHKKISKLNICDISNPLDNLPPVASMVAWLIVSHHKLPILDEKKYADKSTKRNGLFKVISQSWGYEGKEKIDFNEWFKCTELPSKSIEWQQQIKSHAIKLKNLLPQICCFFCSLPHRQLRKLVFLTPMTVSILSSHRIEPPFGLHGGCAGAVGENGIIRYNGETVKLEGCAQVAMQTGDSLEIKTSGWRRVWA